MGLFGDTSDLVYKLAKLVASPRVQIAANDLRGAANRSFAPMTAPSLGPMLGASARTSAPSNSSNIGRNVGAIANQIGSMLGNSGGQQQSDPTMDLYNQLIQQLQSPVQMPTGINIADLMKQVQSAINPIYDARAKSAQSQSARGRQEVQGMYGALADDYKKLAPQQLEQAAAAQKEVEQLYGTLRSNIEGNYSRVSNEQADLFKKLGIEDALPSVLEDQNPAITDALTAASENQAQQQQRYMDMGQADATYYREGSPNALMTGNEISTDMLSELQDYLNNLEGERSSGIQTAYMDQLGQAQNQLGQQQQAAQGEAARRQGMLWEMLQGSLQGAQQTKLTPDSFMAGLPQNQQQSVAGAFTQLQRSPEAIYGKVEDKRNPVPGTFTETTPEWYLAQADQMLKQGAIDPVTHQALLMYIQLYYGMGQ